MLTTTELINYSKWIGLLTLACGGLTLFSFILQWPIRFRLVGATAFMGVLTSGVFALGLGLFNRTEIPNAVRYTRVFDDGARQIVVTVEPSITESQLEATLRQAAADLFSPGRVGRSDQRLTIRARTLAHPEPGISEPLYLGEVKRSIYQRDDENLELQIFSDQLGRLSQ